MFGTGSVRCDKRQIDVGFHGRGKFHLRFLRRFFQALQGHFIVTQIDALIFLEFGHQIIHDALIEIFPAQMRVAVGGFDFEHAVAKFQNRNIKCAAAQIKNGYFFILLFIQTVSQRGGCRFIDNAQNIKTGNFAGVFCRLSL